MRDTKNMRGWIIFGTALTFWSTVVLAWVYRGHPPERSAAPAPMVAPPAPVVAVDPPAPVRSGKIQMALVLDTSSSMDGLIDQARSQLWKVVSQMAEAQRHGSRPTLELALYEYGNTGRTTPRSGWIRQVMPLTEDLDAVSEALFSLTTNGGEEYVGQVVSTATRELSWSEVATDLKMIFVAGNEPFDQGPVAPAKALAAARKRGIVVNAILCGGQDPTWKQGALLAQTDLMVIDQNAAPVHIASPHDAEIEQLGAALNETYMAFGAEGERGAKRQAAQDGNSKGAQAGSMMWRSIAKSKANYKNSAWDLGDAVKDKKVAIEKLGADDLPAPMRGLSVDERKIYVQKKLDERARLQKRIHELSSARDAYLVKKRSQQPETGAALSSLDAAMIEATRKQANAVGLHFK